MMALAPSLRQRMFATLFAAAGMAALAGPVWAVGDPGNGHRLAALWCSSCHIVDAAGRGTDAAPAFASIAERRRDDPTWLRAWLTSPHPPMPNLSLSRSEIDDITAYLAQLAQGS